MQRKWCSILLVIALLLVFFQHYYPEVAPVYDGRKYGYNLKSQLLKLFVIFPAASALGAWICTLF